MGLINFLKNLGANTLYYPGCMLRYGMEKEMENYKQIFNLLGIDFILIPEEVCCGSPVYNAGYRKDSRKLAEKGFKIFKEHKVRKIITPCPGCYNMFKNEFPKLVRDWDIEVEHASQIIFRELKKKKFKRELEKQIVSYHDPCHLGRFSGIYDEPRKIIKGLGGELKEMIHNREEALCCGAGGGLRSNFPAIAKKIAKRRTQEVPNDAEKILTPCGLCSANLKTADDRTLEFSEWVLERMKLAGA
jgi:heterodisulfide reductase subunit D